MGETPIPEKENAPESDVERRIAKIKALQERSSQLAQEMSSYLQDEGSKSDWSDFLNAWNKLDAYLTREKLKLDKEK